MANTNLRLVCASCRVVGTGSVCVKCSGELSPPGPFDCARLGLFVELQALVAQDATFDVNAYEPTSNATILHLAATSGKMGVLEFVLGHSKLRAQVQVDARGGANDTTPLFWAAYHNQIYAVALLLQHGADPTVRDGQGVTPFFVAIQRGFPLVAAYFVAKGSAINQSMQDGSQRTVLMLLCEPAHFHVDSFRMMLNLEAAVDAQDAAGNTALHYAARHNLSMAIRMLLDVQADTQIGNKEGYTPLALACHPEARRLLMDDQHLETLAQRLFLPKRVVADSVYKLAFFVPSLVVPLVYTVVSTVGGMLLMALALVVLFSAAMWLLREMQRGTYGDKRKAAPLMVGITVTSIGYLAGSFPRFCGYCSTLFCVVAALAVTMLGATLVFTATVDPGIVKTVYDDRLHNLCFLVESKFSSATTLCLTCLHQKPLRSKHCAELHACVAKFDHYCPFVGNAIGARNHAAFLGFLLSATVSISMELLACWRYARAQPELVGTVPLLWRWWKWNTSWRTLLFGGQATGSLMGLVDWVWSLAHFDPVLFCIMVLDMVLVVWIAYLHLYLVCTARTTMEMVKNNPFDHVYSRGMWYNLVDFLALPGHKPIDWRRVYRLEDWQRQIDRPHGLRRKAT